MQRDCAPRRAPGDSTAVTSGKKIVEYGWDLPSPAYIADHIREMEERPFAGILFRLEAKGNVFELAPLDEAQLANATAPAAMNDSACTDFFLARRP